MFSSVYTGGDLLGYLNKNRFEGLQEQEIRRIFRHILKGKLLLLWKVSSTFALGQLSLRFYCLSRSGHTAQLWNMSPRSIA